jgi:hypothetical protein
MIKGNTIYFGYGDIAVGSTNTGFITLQWFEPPQEVGEKLKNKEVNWLSDIIKLNPTFKNLKEIEQINEESNKQIMVDGYILDFSEYNSKSVEVVKKHMLNALSVFQLALAC